MTNDTHTASTRTTTRVQQTKQMNKKNYINKYRQKRINKKNKSLEFAAALHLGFGRCRSVAPAPSPSTATTGAATGCTGAVAVANTANLNTGILVRPIVHSLDTDARCDVQRRKGDQRWVLGPPFALGQVVEVLLGNLVTARDEFLHDVGGVKIGACVVKICQLRHLVEPEGEHGVDEGPRDPVWAVGGASALDPGTGDIHRSALCVRVSCQCRCHTHHDLVADGWSCHVYKSGNQKVSFGPYRYCRVRLVFWQLKRGTRRAKRREENAKQTSEMDRR